MSDAQQTKSYEPSAKSAEFIKTHCRRCVAGLTWEIEGGRLVSRCLLSFGDYPASLNVTNCDRFEERETETQIESS